MLIQKKGIRLRKKPLPWESRDLWPWSRPGSPWWPRRGGTAAAPAGPPTYPTHHWWHAHDWQPTHAGCAGTPPQGRRCSDGAGEAQRGSRVILGANDLWFTVNGFFKSSQFIETITNTKTQMNIHVFSCAMVIVQNYFLHVTKIAFSIFIIYLSNTF